MKNVVMDFLVSYRMYCKVQLTKGDISVYEGREKALNSVKQFYISFVNNSIFYPKSELYQRINNEYKYDAKSPIKSFAIFLNKLKGEYGFQLKEDEIHGVNNIGLVSIISDLNHLLYVIKLHFTAVQTMVQDFSYKLLCFEHKDFANLGDPTKWDYIATDICKDKIFYTDKFPLFPYVIFNVKYNLKLFIEELCAIPLSKFDSLMIVSDVFLSRFLGYLRASNCTIKKDSITKDDKFISIKITINTCIGTQCFKTVKLRLILEHNLPHYFRVLGITRNIEYFDEKNANKRKFSSVALRQGEHSWNIVKACIGCTAEAYTIPSHIAIYN